MKTSTEHIWAHHKTRNGSVAGSFEGDPQSKKIPTVLIPGIGGNVDSLKLLAGALHERGHEVITVDTRKARRFGHVALTMSGFARLAAEATKEELDGRSFNLIGHSWGGVLAQRMAVDHPKQVNRLVLLATLPGGVARHPSSLEVQREMLNPDRSQARLERISGIIYGGPFREHGPELVRSLGIAHDVDNWAYARQLTAIAIGGSLHNRIHEIQQRTLIAAGTDDPIAPHKNSDILRKLIPGAELHDFNNGHMFPIEDVEGTANLIDTFLNAA